MRPADAGLLLRGASGSRTTNSAPRPRPSLRASTVPPCSSTSPFTSASPSPSPPAAAVRAVVRLRERLEQPRAASRARSRARVPDAELRRARRARRATATATSRRRVNFAAFWSRLPTTWARRVASASTQSGPGERDVERDPRVGEERLGGPRPCRAPARARSTRLRWSRILPREMRVTSSRSSTSRARCPDLTRDDVPWRARPARRPARPGPGCRGVPDGGERVAQLVREDAEELVLAPVGLAERLLGALAPRDVDENGE